MHDHHIDPVALWPLEFVSSRVAHRISQLLIELEVQSRAPNTSRWRDLAPGDDESPIRDF